MPDRSPATIRPARPDDVSALVVLCREHAVYEKAAFDERDAEARLRGALFGPGGRLGCVVAERDGMLVGYASHSAECSTWNQLEYTHMDCLFIREGQRGGGLGVALMREVSRAAKARGHRELQWQTPSWNEDALRFYRRLNATMLDKVRCTLAGDALDALADGPVPLADLDERPGVAELEPFTLRPARFVELLKHDDWSMKIYAIEAPGRQVDGAAVDAVKTAVRSTLPMPGRTRDRYGWGFAIAHAGEHGFWLLVDWWCAGEILRQRLLWGPPGDPTQLADVTGTDLHGCVHEMEVIEFERRAWMETVLARPADRDFTAYGARRLGTP